MNCEEVEALLLDFVEGALDAPQTADFNAHLDQCVECRENVRKTGEMLDAMQAVRAREEQSWVRTRTHVEPDLSLTPPARLLGTVLGDFEVLDELGRGGMGVVYRARQVSLDRIVALKVLPATALSSKKAVARFRKEARAAAKLQHTNIVPVYAQGDHDGQIYYAMELIQGQSLDKVLREQPTLIGPASPARSRRSGRSSPPSRLRDPDTVLMDLHSKDVLLPSDSDAAPAARAADDAPSETVSGSFLGLSATQVGARAAYHRMALMVAAVAEGLEHAHRSGVIHRDIKPQNLLLGADGQLHITDFGLARLLDEPNVTVTGEMLGTPAYMSPEQVRADRTKIDHRTDVYSLGVTLYQMLAGRRPFEGPSREQIIGRICTDEPRPPRKWNPAVPVDLETICLRAMEKDQRRRYQSAGDMAADLRRYAEDRPIVSRRVGRIERAVKWIRRHPLQTAITTLAFLIVSGGTLWTVQTVQARHATANRLVAEVYDFFAYEDYRGSREQFEKLARAVQLGADELPRRLAAGISRIIDDPGAAIRDLSWAANQEPGNTEILYLLAWAYRRNEQHAECQAMLRRASEAGGARTGAAHFFHAQAVVRNDPETAKNEYRAAMEAHNNYTQAWIHLGRAFNHEMYHERTQEYFSELERYLKLACLAQRNKAYPRYLLSIANRISAEIELSGTADQPSEKALGRLSEALSLAREAQLTEKENPLGYACEAEYWESRYGFEALLAKADRPGLPAEWSPRDDLAAALDARNRGAPFCRTSNEQVDLYQYRWRLHFWLASSDEARADLGALSETCPPTNPLRIWFSELFPALMDAEEGRIAEALDRAAKPAAEAPGDFRAVASSGLVIRLFGRPDAAADLLDRHASRIRSDASTWPVETAAPEAVADEWRSAVYQACRGAVSWDSLKDNVPHERNRKLLRDAPSFFAGLDALAAGRRREALDWFRDCEETYDYEDFSYLARVFAWKMQLDPDWPPWIAAP